MTTCSSQRSEVKERRIPTSCGELSNTTANNWLLPELKKCAFYHFTTLRSMVARSLQQSEMTGLQRTDTSTLGARRAVTADPKSYFLQANNVDVSRLYYPSPSLPRILPFRAWSGLVRLSYAQTSQLPSPKVVTDIIEANNSGASTFRKRWSQSLFVLRAALAARLWQRPASWLSLN